MKENREVRKPNAVEAISTILFLLIVAVAGYIFMGLRVEVLMLVSAFYCAFIAWRCGLTISDMLDGINAKMGECGSLLLFVTGIGFVVGSWLYSGTIPVVISWLVQIVNPAFVLLLSFVACSIVAVILGTSGGTIGTIGVIMCGVATVQGVNPAMAAGAVISGCYVGQIFSPVADMPTLAGQLCDNTDPFTAIRLMLPSGLGAYVIACVAYLFLGRGSASAGTQPENIEAFVNSVTAAFRTSPIILIPLVVLVILIVLKVAPAPSMFVSGFSAILVGWLYQRLTLADGFLAAYSGFQEGMLQAEYEYSQEFLNLTGRGGMTSIASMYVFIIVAMVYAGLMTKMGAIDVVAEVLFSKIKSAGNFILASTIGTMVIQACVGSVYATNFVSAEMFREGFKKLGLSSANLLRVLQTGSTLGVILIPWTSGSVYAANALGIEPLQFIPYLVWIYAAILVNVIMGYTKKGTIREQEKTEE